MTMPLVVVTFKHVLDENAALSDLLVNDELLIIGSHEKDHGYRKVLKGIRLWSVLKMRVVDVWIKLQCPSSLLSAGLVRIM